MAKEILKKGTTSKIAIVKLYSKLDGSPLTGLDNTKISAYYYRPVADNTPVTITLTGTGSLGTYTSGLFKQIDSTKMPGMYELHIPDAALTGADEVIISIVDSGSNNITPWADSYSLISFDLQSPNVALSNTGIDSILTRAISNSEASATAPCLHWAISALAGKSALSSITANSATLTVFKNNGSSTLFAQTLTLSTGINPITAKSIGA